MTKKVFVFTDSVSFGRCSHSVILPIFSVLGHTPIPIYTALFPTHNEGFLKNKFVDTTKFLKNAFVCFKSNNIKPDCIYSGYIINNEQFFLLKNFLNENKNSFKVIDPIFADNGILYKNFNKEIVFNYQKVLKYADFSTPNFTEALFLTEMDLKQTDFNYKKCNELVTKFSKLGAKNFIIKNVKFKENLFYNVLYEKKKNNFKLYKINFIGGHFPGTGDIFCSLITSFLINNKSFDYSLKKTTKFIEKTISYTIKQNKPNIEGIIFEPFLRKIKL